MTDQELQEIEKRFNRKGFYPLDGVMTPDMGRLIAEVKRLRHEELRRVVEIEFENTRLRSDLEALRVAADYMVKTIEVGTCVYPPIEEVKKVLKRLDPGEGKSKRRYEELRYYHRDGKELVLDEVVANDLESFHIEQMSDTHYWFCIDFKDGRTWHFNVGSASHRAKVRLWVQEVDKGPRTTVEVDGKPIDIERFNHGVIK